MIKAFVLAKDERPNIHRTITALISCGAQVTVLDSGSVDGTTEAARAAGAAVEHYAYTDHAAAYNEITAQRTPAGQPCLVVDADMIVNGDLVREACALLSAGSAVVRAPIDMWWGGHRLAHGSLCPPKAFAFRGGAGYFAPSGHGERLLPEIQCATTTSRVTHDDRKLYGAYLLSQARYARQLALRSKTNAAMSWRDRLRTTTPLLVVAIPFVSYVLRGGFLSGKVGLVYTLDRLIAESIMLRECLADDLSESNAIQK
jgi:hypothetical protein